MKKLILTAMATCLSVASQAATANWQLKATFIYDGTGSTAAANKYSGSAFVFDSDKMTQEALYNLIASGSTIGDTTKGYAAKGTVSTGTLSISQFTYGDLSTSASEANTYSFYFAILKDDNVYFSNIVSSDASASASTATSVLFGNQRTTSSVAPTAAGYAGAGAWSSVPEPTSAMLLMLGLCGLALKRKNS